MGKKSGARVKPTQLLRDRLPLILIRGFGGLNVEDEKQLAYQGFNVGTVYPQKRGQNYIFEGMILKFMKSDWQYQDATNVVNYYAKPITGMLSIAPELEQLDQSFFSNHKIVIDPGMALQLVKNSPDPCKTLWVFRYYDLNDRTFATYGEALVRLIEFIQALGKLAGKPNVPVNIIAHSMGGLLAREAIQQTYPSKGLRAEQYINKIVTLGTPHQGITLQVLKEWSKIDAAEELEHFSPEFQKKKKNPTSFVNFHKHFPLERLLTVVGTNYRSYGVTVSSWANRLFSVDGEAGPNYNRSDGLVQQTYAQIPGAPRTFVHKCHGGFDSLVTARESYEIATRFFFANYKVRLRLMRATVLRGKDWIGKSEFFFGVSVKPRGVDFELFHQSAAAENCYGPFHTIDFSDKKPTFDWAGKDRLIWEGYLNTEFIKTGNDIVFRLDFYVGERDLFGFGFSDNVIFRKQYYIRAKLDRGLELFWHTSEDFQDQDSTTQKDSDPLTGPMKSVAKGWDLDVKGTGFKGTCRVELEPIP